MSPSVLVNAHEQRIEPLCSGNVSTDDELLLQVRAELDPRAGSLAWFVGGTDPFAYNAFQAELAHRLKNLSRRRL